MLDVLGFTALVRGDQTERRFKEYLNCVQDATKDTRVTYVVFSDTIVLTTEGNGPDPLLTMAQASSRMFYDLLQLGIPIRGAIAFGNFFRSTIVDSVFVAGSAVVDAYWFEQQQDWVGVMLAPSARACVPDLESRCELRPPGGFKGRAEWAAVIQRCRSIPFHSERSDDLRNFDGFAVVPRKCEPVPVDILRCISDSETRLQWLRGIAPSPASQRKYDATLRWLGSFREDWRGIA